MKRLVSTLIAVTLVVSLLAPALAAGSSGNPQPMAGQRAAATCSDGYALWADSPTGEDVLEWSGSESTITGKVHSNRDFILSGSDNTITGAVSYVTLFDDEGDMNVYPAPSQTSGDTMPVSYDLSAYQPGGAAAVAATQAGRYEYIDGDFEVSDDNVELDKLYYVTGDASLSGGGLHGTMTIVAEGEIELSGSDHDFHPYSDGLLLFSNKGGSEELAISVGGSNSVLRGMFYAPNGMIETSGSENVFTGGLYGHRLKLNGSLLAVTFANQYCPQGSPVPLTPRLFLPGILKG